MQHQRLFMSVTISKFYTFLFLQIFLAIRKLHSCCVFGKKEKKKRTRNEQQLLLQLSRDVFHITFLSMYLPCKYAKPLGSKCMQRSLLVV